MLKRDVDRSGLVAREKHAGASGVQVDAPALIRAQAEEISQLRRLVSEKYEGAPPY